jgi:uncharacterized protein YdeI (YjbR/CyaY-like superfamily)
VAQDDLPVLAFGSTADWHDWLTAHGTDASGVWLKFAKKGAPEQTVTFDEALDVALCFGWIDGQIARFDAEYWLKRFTPRKPRSKWSQINTDKAEALIAAGRMQPARSTRPRLTGAGSRPTRASARQLSPTICARR